MITALERPRPPKASPIITVPGGLSPPAHRPSHTHASRRAPYPVPPITPTRAACRQGVFTTRAMQLSATIRSWIERSRQRQALRKLAERKDYLQDIGVSQAEALREAAQ